MASQADMFGSQEEFAKVMYDYVVLFDKSGKDNPFGIFPTSMFSTEEIKEKWLSSVLDSYSRKKSLTSLERLPGMTLCLFAKIEAGHISFFK